MGSTQETKGNVWSSLPFPLSDLFLQEIAPKYLTVKDFLRLGAVSKRYQKLLGPKTTQGNRILGLLLLRQAKKLHPSSGELLYTEQLPTIGNLSVEESLKEDALLVGQLQDAALGRRRLVLLPRVETEAQELNLRETVATFSGKSKRQMRDVHQRYRDCRWLGPSTEFLGVNLSGVDIYCHWIDVRSRQILVRDGDRVPPAPDQTARVQSFVVNGLDDTALRCVFRHTSIVSHSFALCFQEGGPPFAIYQQRRGWYRSTDTQNGGILSNNGGMHTHAIAIHPGGIIQELHCDSTFRWQPPISFTAHYHFTDRLTNTRIPLSSGAVAEGGEEVAREAAEQAPPDDITQAKELAKAFYGLGVPHISHDLWRQGVEMSVFLSRLHSLTSPQLGRINALPEAIWYEDQAGSIGP